jgi:hypothetical protein
MIALPLDPGAVRVSTQVGLDLFVLALLIRKGMVRYLYFVVVTLVAHILLNVILMWMKPSHFGTDIYAVVYWSLQTILVGSCLYMVECFWKLGLSGYQGFHRLCWIAVSVTMVLLLGFVGFIVSQTPNVTAPNNWINLRAILISRSVHFVLAGLIFLFFLFASVLRVRVARTVSNLAASLMVFSVVRALLQTWLYEHGNRVGESYWWLWYLSMAGMLASWVWIVAHHHVEEVIRIPPVLRSNVSREDLELRAKAANRALIWLLGYGVQ